MLIMTGKLKLSEKQLLDRLFDYHKSHVKSPDIDFLLLLLAASN